MQYKDVSFCMDTLIKRLKVGIRRSVQNLSLSLKHINPSVVCSFGHYSDVMWCWAVLGRRSGYLLKSGYTPKGQPLKALRR